MKPMVNQIICGSNIDVVKSWPANCIDGICTDPPYGLEFMGKEWDKLNLNVPFSEKETGGLGGYKHHIRFGKDGNAMQQWHYQWAKAMLRITKPGGFLLCFGGTRTFHRLACAIEDAGWEIRDCMMWLYGSGFPKSHNISKAIDKAAGAKRKVIGQKWADKYPNGPGGVGFHGGPGEYSQIGRGPEMETAPATSLAETWEGYGTALKPAWEPIIVAMKPLDGTFAHNAEAHGVAGLNIDGGRISYQGETPNMGGRKNAKMGGEGYGFKIEGRPDKPNTQGRWPANLVLDEEAGAMLDEQSGNRKGWVGQHHNEFNPYGGNALQKSKTTRKGYHQGFKDSGGASRFFYCAKTSRKERNMGLEDYKGKPVHEITGRKQGSAGQMSPYAGITGNRIVKNTHPTVKPLALMKYLCTLLKMPSAEQIILDPFLGSGTTAMACAELGIGFIGIEKELEYCEISAKRIAAITGKPLPVTKNEEPSKEAKDPTNDSHHPSPVEEQRQSIINAAVAALRGKKNP